MTSDDLMRRLHGLGPGWLSAVAAGAGAGAVLFPNGRVAAGLVGGGLVLALALWQQGGGSAEEPCGCHDAATKTAPAPNINESAGFTFDGDDGEDCDGC